MRRCVLRRGDRAKCLIGGSFATAFAANRGVNLDERIHYERIVHRPSTLDQNLNRLVVWQFRTVGPVRCKSIETVDHGKNSGSDRNVGSSKSFWVAGAIPVFMVISNDGDDRIWKVDRGEDVCS